MAQRTVTDANFNEDVLASDKPVLAHFWAEWSAGSRQLIPSLEAIAAEHGDSIEIVMLNIDQSPDTAAKYGVMSIPTLIVFKNGEPAHTIVGALPKKRLQQELEPALA